MLIWKRRIRKDVPGGGACTMKHDYMDMLDWFLHKLDAIKDEPAILVCDPLQLLPQ